MRKTLNRDDVQALAFLAVVLVAFVWWVVYVGGQEIKCRRKGGRLLNGPYGIACVAVLP